MDAGHESPAPLVPFCGDTVVAAAAAVEEAGAAAATAVAAIEVCTDVAAAAAAAAAAPAEGGCDEAGAALAWLATLPSLEVIPRTPATCVLLRVKTKSFYKNMYCV